jgi:hypothetical protein
MRDMTFRVDISLYKYSLDKNMRYRMDTFPSKIKAPIPSDKDELYGRDPTE